MDTELHDSACQPNLQWGDEYVAPFVAGAEQHCKRKARKQLKYDDPDDHDSSPPETRKDGAKSRQIEGTCQPVHPKAWSRKILRGTMKKIADGEEYRLPATIDDPAILPEIVAALAGLSYALK